MKRKTVSTDEQEIIFEPTSNSYTELESFCPVLANTDAQLINESFYKDLSRLLKKLEKKQRLVVILSFGLFDLLPDGSLKTYCLTKMKTKKTPILTFGEIGAIINKTDTRASQIRKQAIGHLRYLSKKMQLDNYFAHNFENPYLS